ncbi:hypothetical protein V1509DRAFT_631914 [Lipomyces kononenkoae]
MTITFDPSQEGRLIQLNVQNTSEHIFTLFCEHKPPDNQNLGYISRTARTLPILISVQASLISELASKCAPIPKAEETQTLPTPKKHRRAHRRRQSCIPLESITLQFEVQQSLELLNSIQESSTTGALLWQITPLFAEWLLTPGTVFHDLLFSMRERESGLEVIELGAGTSGILGCALSLALFACHDNDSDNDSKTAGCYTATDQSHILPLLKKNMANNIPVVREVAGRVMHTASPMPYNSVTIAEHDKNPQDGTNERDKRHNLRRNVTSSREVHKLHSRGSHSSESEQNLPRIEVFELDWEQAETDIKYIRDSLRISRDELTVAKKDFFDIVIACDTVYNDFLIVPFVNTLKLLAGEYTHILLGMQLRSHEVQEAFLIEAQSNGLDTWHVLSEHLPERMQSGFAIYYFRRSQD